MEFESLKQRILFTMLMDGLPNENSTVFKDNKHSQANRQSDL